MSKYRQFIFEDYNFDPETKVLSLHYSLDGQIHFNETCTFLFDFVDNYAVEALTRACELLFLVAGVSYYKTYIPPEIVVKNVQIDKTLAGFLSNTYQKGLGEFFYLNKLDPKTPVNFPVNSDGLVPFENTANEGLLVGIGGGKDSLVSVEFLKNQPKVATWSLNHRSQMQPLIERINLSHFYVERNWDQQLLNLNQQGAYNGHVPISSIIAATGAVVAVLSGYRDVVVSNESSTNYPNLTYQGVEINHQYSKSLVFEQALQAVLSDSFGDSIRYYSFLRPLSDLYIAEIFGRNGLEKYKDVFSSCNRAYTHDSDEMFWCGECPKCAFVFLALTPFVDRSKLEALFGGKNLLLDPALETTYRQLLGIEGDKPLECVGEIKESRAAMRLAQKQYPQLLKYKFDLPTDYDYRSLQPHSMPEDIYQMLMTQLP